MSKIYLLPISVFFLIEITFIGTYIESVKKKRVLPTFPFISDDAAFSPGSCVFAQFINMASVLLGITVYLRYRHLLIICSELANFLTIKTKKLNLVALFIGLIACVGLNIVANFQESKVRTVHFLGASLTFGSGTIYFCLQAALSYCFLPYAGSILIAHLRLGMSVFCIIFTISGVITNFTSRLMFDGENEYKWLSTDGGYQFHLTSTISEWIVATLFSFYILSFTVEFRNLYLAPEPLQNI